MPPPQPLFMTNDPRPSTWIGAAPPPTSPSKKSLVAPMTLGAPCRSSAARFQDVLLVLSAAHPKTVSSPPLIRRVSKSVSDDSLAYSMSTSCRDYDSPPQRGCSFQLEAACIDPKVMISLTSDIVESKSSTGDMNQSASWSQCTIRLPRIATSSTMDCDEDTLATFTTLYNPASNEMKLLDGDGHQGNDVEWMPPPPRVERFQNSLRLLLGKGKYDEEAVVVRSRTWSQRPAAAGSRKMADSAASWRPKSHVGTGTGTAEDVQWTPPRYNSIDLGLSTSEKHDQWNASLDGADPMTIVAMESNGTLLTSSGTFSGTNETNVFTTAGTTTITVSAGLLDGPNGEGMEASLNDDFMQVQEAARNHSLGGSNEHNGGDGLETAPQRRRRPVRVLENVASSGAKVIFTWRSAASGNGNVTVAPSWRRRRRRLGWNCEEEELSVVALSALDKSVGVGVPRCRRPTRAKRALFEFTVGLQSTLEVSWSSCIILAHLNFGMASPKGSLPYRTYGTQMPISTIA
jgi:hypothetical protein